MGKGAAVQRLVKSDSRQPEVDFNFAILGRDFDQIFQTNRLFEKNDICRAYRPYERKDTWDTPIELFLRDISTPGNMHLSMPYRRGEKARHGVGI